MFIFISFPFQNNQLYFKTKSLSFPSTKMHLHTLYTFVFYLFFLAALGLRCCTRAFSSCGERGLLSSCGAQASHRSGFSSCRAQALGCSLWFTGLVAPQHVGSPQTRDRTHVPCIGRWILNHWATREVLSYPF